MHLFCRKNGSTIDSGMKSMSRDGLKILPEPNSPKKWG